MRLFTRTSTRKQFANTTRRASKLYIAPKTATALLIITLISSCSLDSASTRSSLEAPQSAVSTASAEDFFIVDCLLPSRRMRLGLKATYLARPQLIQTTRLDCGIRGGRQLEYDRSNYKTSRAYWQSLADQGNKEAQNYLGEIYERGLGTEPDYEKAAKWYRRAADQGFAPAQINLGKLYELGLGVPVDKKKAIYWYRKASGLPDLQLSTNPTPPKELKDSISPKLKKLDFGRYHALIIGNNNYKNLERLETAQADAEAVAEVLRTKYDFNIIPLYNASEKDILVKLLELKKTLAEEDNLLIYYAGHGDYVETKTIKEGYWLPIGAGSDRSGWLANQEIKIQLSLLSPRHVIVVADSCYSGTLADSMQANLGPRHTKEELIKFYYQINRSRSRTALTSGGLKPVLDEGSDGHSVFANAFLKALRSNDGIMDEKDLYAIVSVNVAAAAFDKQFEQVPKYGPVNSGGHGGGEFIFVPKTWR